MNSVMVKQEAKAEQSKSKKKLKIPKFFNSIVAKMSPTKLAVDAVPVKKNGFTAPVESDIEEIRVNSIDPWQSVSSVEFENASSVAEELPASNRQLVVPPPLLISPNPNHSAPYGLLQTNKNSMAVSNVGVQNNYNFSRINGLHIGNVNVHQAKAATNGISNGGNSASEQGAEASKSTQKIPKTKSISELMKSTELLDEPAGNRKMRFLSKHMGASWRFTLRALGFTEAEIDQRCSTYLNLREGVYEIIYSSLYDWSCKQGDATVGQLCTILWENDQKECVRELKNHLKKERTRNESESSSENGVGLEMKEKSMTDEPTPGDSDK